MTRSPWGEDMKVFTKGRESGPLTYGDWKDVRKPFHGRAASGRVMNSTEAWQAALRRMLILGTFLVAVCWIIALCVVAAEGLDGLYSLVGAGLAAIITYPLCVIWIPFWRMGLAERYLGLPEPGVLVSADEAGLAIGERAASWRDLSLEALYLKLDADDEPILERLTLSGAFEGVSLDLELIENGRDIVGYIFLRLCPEPPKDKA